MPSREELEQKRRELLAALAQTDAQLAELPEEEAEAPPPPPDEEDDLIAEGVDFTRDVDGDDGEQPRPKSQCTERRTTSPRPASPRPASRPASPRPASPLPLTQQPPRTALPPAAVVPRPGPCPLQFGSTGKEMREFAASINHMTLDGPDPHGKQPYACWANSPAFKALSERLAKAERLEKASLAPFGLCIECAAATRVDDDLVDGARCCFNAHCLREYCEDCVSKKMEDGDVEIWYCGDCPRDVFQYWMAEPFRPDSVPGLLEPVEFSDELKAQIMSDEPDLKVLGRLLAQELSWLPPPKRFDPKNPVHLSSLLERLRTWEHANWRRLGMEGVGATESRVSTFCERRLERAHPGLVEKLKGHDDDCKKAAKAAAGEPPDRCVLCGLRDKVVAEAYGKVSASRKRGRPSSEAVATLAAEALSELRELLPLATSAEDLAAVDCDEEKEAETAPGEGKLVPDHLKYWPLIRLIDGEPCWACNWCNTKVSFIFCTFPHDIAVQLFTRAITWACTSLATQTTASAAAS